MELNVNFEPFLHAIEPWLVYFYLCSWCESRVKTLIHPEFLQLAFVRWLVRISCWSLTWLSVIIFSWFWFKLPVEVFHLPGLTFEQCCMFFILIEFMAVPFHRNTSQLEMTPEQRQAIEEFNKVFPKKVKK